ELKAYAAEQRVDVFISAVAREGDDGWELALRLRDSDGKALGRPVTFRANTLGALVKDLKGNGQVRVDRAMRGAPPSRAARSVVASTEGSLEEAEQSWDADGDAAPSRAKPRKAKAKAARAKAEPAEEPEAEPRTQERVPDRGRATYLRFAMAGAAPPPAPPEKRAPARKKKAKRAVEERAPEPRAKAVPVAVAAAPDEIDLDAATSDALEEGPSPSPPAETVLDADADLQPTQLASVESERDSSALGPAESADDERQLVREDDTDSAAALVASVGSSLDAAEQGPSDTGVDGSERRGLDPAPTVVASVQAGLLRRQLEYVDDLYGRLRAPTTNGWVYRADAAFYPFAEPLKSRLSLFGSFEGSFAGAVVDDRTDQTYDVTFSEFAGGLRYRHPLGNHGLGFRASVGHMSSGLDDPEGRSGVPEFSYTYLTPSVDVDLRFGSVSLRAELGYRHSLGDFGEAGAEPWFPRMQGYGFESKLGFEYRFTKQVAFVLSGALRRFVLEMNSEPEDASTGNAEVAAGAVDQYLSGYAGLQLTL
ncbi:MAG TPA: hypothetical protein VJU61_14765, partial [Polyangiaceae bacterium]|nr:hypothetical protein [Polyangiaceae bacterium]